MTGTASRRRGHGEDAIYFDAAKNRFVGAISVGFGPDGKRVRRKVTGRTKPLLFPAAPSSLCGAVSRCRVTWCPGEGRSTTQRRGSTMNLCNSVRRTIWSLSLARLRPGHQLPGVAGVGPACLTVRNACAGSTAAAWPRRGPGRRGGDQHGQQQPDGVDGDCRLRPCTFCPLDRGCPATVSAASPMRVDDRGRGLGLRRRERHWRRSSRTLGRAALPPVQHV